MKRLALNWMELMAAFDDSSWEISYYLDAETGEVLTVTEEALWHLEQIYEQFDPEGPEPFDIEAGLARLDLPDWQEEDVLAAHFVEGQDSNRVIPLPDTPTYDAYEEMQDFIATIQDDDLYHELREATLGRGAFGRFRDILYGHLAQQERWYVFQANRLRERVLEWLADQGIEPMEVPQPAEVNEEDLLQARHKLLDEVVIFVRAASRIPGVMRIALIGSLTTDKHDPKDADLLVTVAEDADLTGLATLGRKLQGHAQSFNRGGDVFLADAQHRYLGRTCPWKRCGRGIRVSCDALHCGRRPYLHDDLEAVTLAEELIARPPLQLWPEVVATVPLPEDVDKKVVRVLKQGV